VLKAGIKEGALTGRAAAMATVKQPAPAGPDYLQRARALAPTFVASQPHEEDARELDPRLLTEMHKAGLFRMLLPHWLNGGALDPLSYTRVVEEIAKFDPSAAWCLNQGSGCSMAAGYLEEPVAREIFGPPDGVLAWGPSPGAKAIATEGGYIVNYSGSFASGSRHATWLGALCLVCEADGSPRLRANGKQEMRALLFPRTSADVKDVWHVVGLRGTGSDSFSVKDLFVSSRYTYIRDDEATRIDSSPHYRYASTMIYSSGFAHVALGIARGFMDAFMALAAHKTPREARSTLKDNPMVQFEVAQCEAKWKAARHYLRANIREAWQQSSQTARNPTDAQRVAIRLAATHAIHSAKEVVATLYETAGASSILESGPFERRFRDINTVTQQLQGRKAHYESAGKFMLGVPIDLDSAQI
jgi:alkylation response protein AidB-like acyl-CoA dehydrogenase